jgi:hypothetical protein
VALPWLCSGFVGYLGPGEVLALWDRVIGYDSLLVLPLLAAAVLIFRWVVWVEGGGGGHPQQTCLVLVLVQY